MSTSLMLYFSTATGLRPLVSSVRLEIFAAELAVVGRVGEDGHLGVFALDDFLDDHGRLDRVVGRGAEDVVVGKFRRQKLLGDDRAGRDVVDHRNLRFLVEPLRGQRHAGVDEADGGDDILLVDQLLGDLHAAFVLRLVVALYQFDLAAEHATFGVDFVDREFDAIAHRHAHRARTAGERTRYADLDGVGGHGSKRKRCRGGDPKRLEVEFHVHLQNDFMRLTNADKCIRVFAQFCSLPD